MKKKYLALFINDLRRFNSILTAERFLFQKICENFEKLFIINIENLCFFSSGTSGFKNKDFFFDKKKRKLIIKNKNLKLPNNTEFFQPLDANDFKKFMFDKDIVGINSFGRSFKELKAHFLLKKYNEQNRRALVVTCDRLFGLRILDLKQMVMRNRMFTSIVPGFKNPYRKKTEYTA